MKRQSAHLFVAAVLALLGPLSQKGRGNFILWNDEQLTVNKSHNQGILYDRSRAYIISGGSVSYIDAYDSSTVEISGGSVDHHYAYDSSTVTLYGGSVTFLYAYDSSTVGISWGSVYSFGTFNSSTANISGGSVDHLSAYNSSAVEISGGTLSYLYACDSNKVNISGGSITNLDTRNSSAVSISGGSVNSLVAYNSSTVTFYGQNFRVGSGLTFDGDRVLGTGILSGEWMDGTRWATNIAYNETTATILAIPESAHKPFCVKYPRMDFNGDCKVDFADFAIMASSWLECNLVPQSACWE